MNVMLAVVTATALVGGGALAVQAGRDAPQIVQASYTSDEAQLTPQRLVIAIDLSKSNPCLLYTSPSPRDRQKSRMPSSA